MKIWFLLICYANIYLTRNVGMVKEVSASANAGKRTDYYHMLIWVDIYINVVAIFIAVTPSSLFSSLKNIVRGGIPSIAIEEESCQPFWISQWFCISNENLRTGSTEHKLKCKFAESFCIARCYWIVIS